MNKLTSAQDAIKQAIEGGYDWRQWATRNLFSTSVTLEQFLKTWLETDFENDRLYILTDPLFWQSLGKARGWKEHVWGLRALEWLSNRMSGGDEKKFWESLP